MNIEQLLAEGPIDGAHIALVAAMAAFFSVLTVWRAMLERSPLQRRISALAGRRDALKRELTAAKRRGTQVSRSVGFAKRTVERLKLMRGQTAAQAAKKLVQAGFRSNDAVAVYLFAKLCLPLACGAGAVIALYVFDLGSLPDQTKMLAACGSVLAGFYLPELFIKNIIQKRQAALIKALPDMLDLMVICTETGSSLDATLGRVAHEIRPSSRETAEDVELTGIELGFLPDRRQALENFCDRTGIKHIDALVSTLIQTEKYGTPLAQSLRVLARELRDERLMAAEAKAARLPATLMVPMVIFILPVLFIVLIGPGAINVMDGLRSL